MLKLNRTFEDLQILQDLHDAWLEVGPQIKNYMETSTEIKLLQVGFICSSFSAQDECVMAHLRLES